MGNTSAPAASKVNYIALLQQAAEGCDHTISCGTHMVPLKATTPDEAVAECKELLAEYRGERALRSLYIFETSRSLKVPVDEVYRELDEREANASADAEEAKARAQYAALQKRFGNG